MTSKKRRGRRQESLPLEPAAVGGARVDSDLAAGAPASRHRDRRSAGPSSGIVEARIEGLAETGADMPAGSDPGLGGSAPMADVLPPADDVARRDEAGAPSGVATTDGTAGPDAVSTAQPEPVGARLRAARESRGLTRDALAAAARIPLSAIGHIERGDLAALGAPIYARGFLRSYARAVGVPEVVVDAALRDVPAEEPALIVANPASVGDRFAARYKNPLVYALLTVVVVVPLVFLATPQSTRDSAPAFAPLDAELPAASRASATGHQGAETGEAATTLATTPPAALPPAPVMASMAPMSSPMAAPRPAGTRVLVLRVSEPSWIELTAADGRRLEYAQLQPGTTREYAVDGGADLVVGNVPGVVATLNGRPVDLNAVANRNVARLRVGDVAPPAGQ